MIRNILYLAIFTSIIVLSWIAFGVYHNYTTTTISQDAQILITPIEPNFDNKTIDNIKKRNVVDANLALPRANAEPTTTPQATQSAPIVQNNSQTINPELTISPTQTILFPTVQPGL